MKSLIKRLSTFLVASAMAISSSIAVSAAEFNENLLFEDMQYVVMTVNEEGMSIETMDELSSTFSTTKDFVYMNQTDLLAGSKVSSSFTYPGTGSITVVFAATGEGTGCLNITSKDYNDVFYSLNGQTKSKAFYGMTGKQTVKWEVYAAGGNLSRWALIISGVYD